MDGLFENFTTDSNLCEFDRDGMSGVGHSALNQTDEAAATGNLHIDHMDEFNIVGLNDVGEFFPIEGGIIEFGAAAQGDFSLQEPAVEIRESEGRAVRRDQ